MLTDPRAPGGLRRIALALLLAALTLGPAAAFEAAAFADDYVGTEGDDVIPSPDPSNPPDTSGSDTVDAKGGDDEVTTGAGNDTVDAGSGNDYVDAGDDSDTVNGGDGTDEIYGGNGDDVVNGDGGDDKTIYDTDSSDVTYGGLYGGSGNDKVSGGDGNDYIDGGPGDDELSGDDGSDEIHGDGFDFNSCDCEVILFSSDSNLIIDAPPISTSFNDLLLGGAGDDTLYGELGDDTLYGGSGDDTLYGGSGDDLLCGETPEGSRNDNDQLYGGDGTDLACAHDDATTISGDQIGKAQTFDAAANDDHLLYLEGDEADQLAEVANTIYEIVAELSDPWIQASISPTGVITFTTSRSGKVVYRIKTVAPAQTPGFSFGESGPNRAAATSGTDTLRESLATFFITVFLPPVEPPTIPPTNPPTDNSDSDSDSDSSDNNSDSDSDSDGAVIPTVSLGGNPTPSPTSEPTDEPPTDEQPTTPVALPKPVTPLSSPIKSSPLLALLVVLAVIGTFGRKGLSTASRRAVLMTDRDGNTVARHVAARDAEGWGDRSFTWRFPGHGVIDAASIVIPDRLARFSPLIGRVTEDGSEFRAMFGTLWIATPLIGVALGIAAASAAGGSAAPPSLWLLIAGAVLATFDAFAGILAVVIFAVPALIGLMRGTANGLDAVHSVLVLLAIGFLWMAIPLIGSAIRPFRRIGQPSLRTMWDKLGDGVIASLLCGWVAMKLTAAMDLFAGQKTGLPQHANTVALIVMAAVALRMATEHLSIVAYPKRLQQVEGEDPPPPFLLSSVMGAFLRAAVFGFIGYAFIGSCWQLWLGTTLFLIPQLVEHVREHFRKVGAVQRILPRGVVEIFILVVACTLAARFAMERTGNQLTGLRLAFLLIAVPPALIGALALFAEDKETGESTWFGQLLGLGVVIATTALALHGWDY